MRTLMVGLVPLLMACSAEMMPVHAQDRAAVTERTISVTGVGRATAAPDLAVLTFGVVESGKTAGDALSANSKKMSAVTRALKQSGIADRDLQTSDFNLNPIYGRDERGRTDSSKVVGYRVSNTLTIRVRDVATAGETIDLVVGAGVNQFNGLRFAFDDPTALQTEARKAAVRNGKAIASMMAEEAGVKLGTVVTMSEHSSNPTPRPMARMMVAEDAAMATPIEAGESELSVSVHMVFELK